MSDPVNFLFDATFGLQLEASGSQLSFFAYSCVWEFFCLQFELFCLQFELFCLQLSVFAYSGKVCLRSTSMDCKQRSSTVSKKAETVSKKKASPLPLWVRFSSLIWIRTHQTSSLGSFLLADLDQNSSDQGQFHKAPGTSNVPARCRYHSPTRLFNPQYSDVAISSLPPPNNAICGAMFAKTSSLCILPPSCSS